VHGRDAPVDKLAAALPLTLNLHLLTLLGQAALPVDV
jgi:hypothetical protein